MFDHWFGSLFHKEEKEAGSRGYAGKGKEYKKREKGRKEKEVDLYDEAGYDRLGIHRDHVKHVAFNILKGNQLEIDLHGLNKDRTSYMVNDILDHVDDRIKEIVLIHGYNSGTVLRDYIRDVLDHERIREEIFDWNNGGRTILKIGKRSRYIC